MPDFYRPFTVTQHPNTVSVLFGCWILVIAIFMAIIGHCNANCIARSLFENARRSEPKENDEKLYTIKPGWTKKKHNDITPPLGRPNRCCPYEFDGTDCRVLDDRVLCGYDKNVGKPKSKKHILSLSGGCRLRGGRLECGYEQGPFTNPRRPPVWDHPPQHEDADGPGNSISNEHSEKNTRRPAAVTKCVEMDNRIVCRKV